MKKDELKRLIIRMLLEREVYGYEISKELSMKGVKLRPNYVYTILNEMEKRGLLKGKWVKNPTGPRRHFYSLSEKGEEEFRRMIKEALNLLMGAYIRFNLTIQDFSGFIRMAEGFATALGAPVPTTEKIRFVLVIPYYDPLICYPFIYNICEFFPNSSIYIVKPPELKIYEQGPNLTLLDGWRHDIPLKDDFADFLMVMGFPKRISEHEAIREWARVLKDVGHIIIQVSNVMIEEKAPRYPLFSEFVAKLYYDVYDEDRTISIERVKRLLLRYFNEVKDMEALDATLFYAKRIL